jgi:hypothetical protein
MSGDPLEGDAIDPQSLNKYAYVRDNPINLIDPSGRDGQWINGKFVDTVTEFEFGNLMSGGAADGGPVDPCASGGLLGGPQCTRPQQPAISASQVAAPAPNKTPWYKNSCVQNALLKGAVTTAIDAIGLIPEGSIASRAIGNSFNYRGIVADQFGNKAIGSVEMGSSIFLTASSGHDAQVSGGAWSLSGLQAGVGVVGIAKNLGAFIPVANQTIAAVSVGLDIVSTGMEIANCH